MKTSESRTPRTSSQVTLARLTFLAAVCLTFVPSACAATKAWSGRTSPLWSTVGNWGASVPPVDGDDVLFPAGALNKSNTNNLVNLRLRSISFTDSGYSLGGNSVTITNGVRAEQVSGGNTINFDIQLGAAQTFECVNAAAAFVLNGFIELGDSTLTVTNTGDVTFTGYISGAGGLIKQGSGALRYLGISDNIYTGPTDVRGGVLELGKTGAKSLAHSALTISNATVRHSAGYQIGYIPVTINRGGLLDLNGFPCLMNGSLALNDGGDVETGSGSLNLTGNYTVTVNPGPGTGESSTISGNLALFPSPCTFDVAPVFSIWPNGLSIPAKISGAPLRKTGNGILYLSGSNVFSGEVHVEAGTLAISHAHALGDTSAGTTVSNAATLRLSDNIHVSKEALTLASTDANGAVECTGGTNTWDGPVTLAEDAVINISPNARLTLSGSIGGAGDLTKTGIGTLVFSGDTANSYGDTFVNAGTLELAKVIANSAIAGNLTIGDGNGGINADVVRLKTMSQILTSSRVTVNSSGLFDLEQTGDNIGSLEGSGNVTLGSNTLGLGSDNSSTSFSGVISGAGSLWKFGAGTFTLTGDNTYLGETAVHAGILLVNGSQPASPVVVSAAGTLGGRGTVGHVNCVGGVIQPGTSPGILTCSNLALNASSSFRVELNGRLPGLLGYDQLNVRGTNNLGGAALEVALGFTPARDDAFAILNNDGHDKTVGTFAGLTNGATLSVGLADFRINYDGDTGNDVVLTTTRVYPALVITNVAPAGTNLDLRWSSSRPDYVVEKAMVLGTNMTWQAVAGPMKDTKAAVPRDTPNGFFRVRGGN